MRLTAIQLPIYIMLLYCIVSIMSELHFWSDKMCHLSVKLYYVCENAFVPHITTFDLREHKVYCWVHF